MITLQASMETAGFTVVKGYTCMN